VNIIFKLRYEIFELLALCPVFLMQSLQLPSVLPLLAHGGEFQPELIHWEGAEDSKILQVWLSLITRQIRATLIKMSC